MTPHGLLLVDKASGLSSHRVVQVARRALRTRAVGHAGTLDPMATGLLVLGVGEGTKLLHHLTGADKAYSATVSLGAETDSLDADGCVVGRDESVVAPDAASVGEALGALLEQPTQVPPAVSAIKRDGEPMYRKVRRGEDVVLEPRTVRLLQAELLSLDGLHLELELVCSKGYYVRAMARDLAAQLGTLGHLAALRRTRVGEYSVADAVPFAVLEAAAREQQPAPELTSLAAAVSGLHCVVVDGDGEQDCVHGRPVVRDCLLQGEWPTDGVEPVAVLSSKGVLLALARGEGDNLQVVRGFRY